MSTSLVNSLDWLAIGCLFIIPVLLLLVAVYQVIVAFRVTSQLRAKVEEFETQLAELGEYEHDSIKSFADFVPNIKWAELKAVA